MGIRFRRSLKILPGVRVNLGKKGVSVSTGVKGANMTAGTSGVRLTAGLPGTGLSYTHKVSSHTTSRQAAQAAALPAAPPLDYLGEASESPYVAPPKPDHATAAAVVGFLGGALALAAVGLGVASHWVLAALSGLGAAFFFSGFAVFKNPAPPKVPPDE
jgi:hypothetical protein